MVVPEIPVPIGGSQTSEASTLKACLQAARDGSSDALGQLVQKCRAYLLLVANREWDPELRAKGGASDIVQDTFLEAQRSFVRFRGETEKELMAWLRCVLLANVSNFERRYRRTDKRQVAREVQLDHHNRNGDGLVSLVPADTPSPSWQYSAREEAEAVERALQRLPDDYARVILLVHREHRSLAEAAAVMNRSVDAVRRLWSRAIDRLAHELETGHERPGE
jgi:RNA polymerase sigma-70 factor (ECF subfamily)